MPRARKKYRFFPHPFNYGYQSYPQQPPPPPPGPWGGMTYLPWFQIPPTLGLPWPHFIPPPFHHHFPTFTPLQVQSHVPLEMYFSGAAQSGVHNAALAESIHQACGVPREALPSVSSAVEDVPQEVECDTSNQEVAIQVAPSNSLEEASAARVAPSDTPEEAYAASVAPSNTSEEVSAASVAPSNSSDEASAASVISTVASQDVVMPSTAQGAAFGHKPTSQPNSSRKTSLRLQLSKSLTQIHHGAVGNQSYIAVTPEMLNEDHNAFEVKPSGDAGRGVFTVKPIKAGDFVLEYKGDLVSAKEGIARERTDNNIHSYRFFFFFKNRKLCIDASAESHHLGRLLNHSIDGNVIAKCVPLDRSPHICFFASRDITAGEELTYHYGDLRPSVVKQHPWLALKKTVVEEIVKCPICLGNLAEETMKLQCLHTFCKVCIQEWFKVRVKCPLCRQEPGDVVCMS